MSDEAKTSNIEIARSILLAAAEEGAIDNFSEADLLKVTAKARELLGVDALAKELDKSKRCDEFHARRMMTWQRWASGLLSAFGLQLDGGVWGDDNARRILGDELSRLAAEVARLKAHIVELGRANEALADGSATVLKAEAAKQAPPARTAEELAKKIEPAIDRVFGGSDNLAVIEAVAKAAAKVAIAHLSAPQVVEPLTQEELCIAVGAAKEEWERQDLPGNGILFITRAVANAQRAKARPVDVAEQPEPAYHTYLHMLAVSPRTLEQLELWQRERHTSRQGDDQSDKVSFLPLRLALDELAAKILPLAVSAPPQPAQGEPLVESVSIECEKCGNYYSGSATGAPIECVNCGPAHWVRRCLAVTAARMPATTTSNQGEQK